MRGKWTFCRQTKCKTFCRLHFNTFRPRQSGDHFSRGHFQMHFCEWKCQLWLIFLWILFLRAQFIISGHWFGWWLGTKQATSHYLNQWWPSLLTHICVSGPQCVRSIKQTVSLQMPLLSVTYMRVVWLPRVIYWEPYLTDCLNSLHMLLTEERVRYVLCKV